MTCALFALAFAVGFAVQRRNTRSLIADMREGPDYELRSQLTVKLYALINRRRGQA